MTAATSNPQPSLIEPHATLPGTNWLEVFYDLAYGVIITELTNRLDADPSLRGFLVFVGLFLTTWWVWVGFAVYASRIDADDLVHRLFVFVQMLAIAAMAVQIRDSSFGGIAFASAFIVARLSLLALYHRACAYVDALHPVARAYTIGFGGGIALWVGSMFLPPHWRYRVWAIAMVWEMSFPWIARKTLREVPVNRQHLPERLGTFSTIVLYIAVQSVITGVADTRWRNPAGVIALLAFALAACVWWIGSNSMGRIDMEQVLGSGQPFIYVHLPAVIGLSMISVGIRRAILNADAPHMTTITGWLLCGGGALWLVGMLLLRWIVAKAERGIWAICFSVGVVLVGTLRFVGVLLQPLWSVGLLTAVFVGLALVDHYFARGRDVGAHPHTEQDVPSPPAQEEPAPDAPQRGRKRKRRRRGPHRGSPTLRPRRQV